MPDGRWTRASVSTWWPVGQAQPGRCPHWASISAGHGQPGLNARCPVQRGHVLTPCSDGPSSMDGREPWNRGLDHADLSSLPRFSPQGGRRRYLPMGPDKTTWEDLGSDRAPTWLETTTAPASSPDMQDSTVIRLGRSARQVRCKRRHPGPGAATQGRIHSCGSEGRWGGVEAKGAGN